MNTQLNPTETRLIDGSNPSWVFPAEHTTAGDERVAFFENTQLNLPPIPMQPPVQLYFFIVADEHTMIRGYN